MDHPASPGSRTLFGRDVALLILICGLYGSLVRFFVQFPSPVEDSYILFRYASHFARGDGLTWNLGPIHDQGMTGVLWLTLLGFASRYSHAALPVLAGGLGIGVGCLCLVLVYVSLRRALPDSQAALAAIGTLALALTPVFIRHSGSGMETVLTCTAFAVTVCATTFLQETRPEIAVAASAIISATMFLVRPDATLFSMVTLNVAIFLTARTRRFQWTLMSIVGSLSLVALEVLLLGRYFATALPLPVYIKLSVADSGHSLLRQMLSMLPWIASYQIAMLSISAMWLVFIAVGLSQSKSAFRASDRAILAGAATFYLYLFTVRPLMNFNIRYQAPLLIPVIYLGTLGLSSLVSLVWPRSENRAAAKYMLLACVACYSLGSIYSIKVDAKLSSGDHQEYKALAIGLSKIKGVALMSTEAGVLAYYSDVRFFDLFGLNATFVAKHYRDAEYGNELNSYLDSKFGMPDIYIRRLGGIGPYADLCNFPSILSRYDYVAEFPEGGTNVEVYVLRQGPRSAAIKEIVPSSFLKGEAGCRGMATNKVQQ